MRPLLALFLLTAIALPAAAAERTFVLSPADLARMVDEFNGDVLAHSATYGRQVAIRSGAVRFFGRSCPALGAGGYAASRVRILDGTTNPAILAGHKPNLALADALAGMGADAWAPPAEARTRRQAWVVAPPATGEVGFATAGFATGDPRGTIDNTATTDTTPEFLLDVDLGADVGSDPATLVLALTTEPPPTRPGRMPKRSECFLVGDAPPADLPALVEMLAATPLSDDTRPRLAHILDDASNWLAHQQRHRAARATKRFALEVASRTGFEIPAAAGEELVARALLVTDALWF